jgi:hypothetical protein
LTPDSHRAETAGRKVVDLHGAHDFRHTFSTWLEDAGIPARIIDDLMGHQASGRTGRHRGRLSAVLAAAALLLAVALAVPVGATTLVATLGDKTTYFNHFGDPARGQVRAYAQGQVLDLDDNGSADALRGKGGLAEVRGVLRTAIYDLELQVLRDGAFVPVAENTSEVNSGGVQPARATQWTPSQRFCPVPGLPDQTYRVVHLDGIRWNDNTFSSRTTYSAWFSAYPLEDDPSCVAPGPSATLQVSVSDSPDPVLNGERAT